MQCDDRHKALLFGGPLAEICGRFANVRFTPKKQTCAVHANADIAAYSIASSARGLVLGKGTALSLGSTIVRTI